MDEHTSASPTTTRTEHFSDGVRPLRHERQPDADAERAAEGRRAVRAAERRQRLSRSNIYINAKWQFNANALYQAPWGLDISGNVFGRQGLKARAGCRFRQGTTAALGGDSTLSVHGLRRTIDYLRYPRISGTPTCGRRGRSRSNKVTLRGILDGFNIFNANTVLVRNNNIASTTFSTIAAEP